MEYLNDKNLLILAEMLNDLGSLKNLLLSFKCCKSISDAGVVAVVEGLPAVTLLKLDLAFCNITDDTIESLASRMNIMPELGVMHISLQGCQDITEAAIRHLVQVLPSSLKGAKLNLCDIPLPMSLQKLCRRLPTMRAWAPLKPIPISTQSRGNAEVQEASTEKPGLSLKSLDLFVRRGFVQDPKHSRARAEAKPGSGRESPWQEAGSWFGNVLLVSRS